MNPAAPTLDATYRSRAIPLGSARYWSWLFASPEARPPLLAIHALLAEWSALMDPATEPSAGRIKLAWWQEEVRRLMAGRPAHPIGAYLLSLPRADSVDLTPLAPAIDAVVAECDGAPLERASDLEPHAVALRAGPLMIASRLANAALDQVGLQECARCLAVGDFLARSARDYRRDARRGRLPFVVEELLAAGIDNADLCADSAPPQVADYLHRLRSRAQTSFGTALQAPRPQDRAALRHLLILASLGRKQAQHSSATLESPRLQDMLLAWSTARRAQG